MWFERERTMAREIELKYGVNPNQKPARIFMEEGELPLKVLSGRPGSVSYTHLMADREATKAKIIEKDARISAEFAEQ